MSAVNSYFDSFDAARAQAQARAAYEELHKTDLANAGNLATRFALYQEIQRVFPRHPLIADDLLKNNLMEAAKRLVREVTEWDEVRKVGRDFKYEGGFASPQGIEALKVFLRRQGVEFSDGMNDEVDHLIFEMDLAETRRLNKERAEAQAAADAKWTKDIAAARAWLGKGVLGMLVGSRPDLPDYVWNFAKAERDGQGAAPLTAPVVPAPGMRPASNPFDSPVVAPTASETQKQT